MENINTALMMLAIGMGTVFLILVFIIFFSKLLIRLINKYVPSEDVSSAAKSGNRNLSPKIIAAISTAVNLASAGKMKVIKIEK